MVYDYYDFERYDYYLNMFYNEVEQLCGDYKFDDVYLSYLENSERFFNTYDIDEDAYLFNFARTYALNGKIFRMNFSKHPYVNSFKIDKDKKHISTIFGDLDFKFWINGYSDAFLRAFKGNDFFESYKVYSDVYSGKYIGRCHEASMKFGYGNTIVTAFMHEPLGNLRYLHSFVEIDDKVLDATANLIISKDDYYRLLKPEIVSEISGTELYEFYHECVSKYPKLRHMSSKQFLAEYDEIKKAPYAVKVKTWKR